MQAALTVCVFVDTGECKTCLKLSADLFGNRMRKLPTAAGLFKLPAVFFVDERIKRKRVYDSLLLLIDNIVHADVQSAQ